MENSKPKKQPKAKKTLSFKVIKDRQGQVKAKATVTVGNVDASVNQDGEIEAGVKFELWKKTT